MLMVQWPYRIVSLLWREAMAEGREPDIELLEIRNLHEQLFT